MEKNLCWTIKLINLKITGVNKPISDREHPISLSLHHWFCFTIDLGPHNQMTVQRSKYRHLQQQLIDNLHRLCAISLFRYPDCIIGHPLATYRKLWALTPYLLYGIISSHLTGWAFPKFYVFNDSCGWLFYSRWLQCSKGEFNSFSIL